MRVCFVSDLHVDHMGQPNVDWPEADVLIIAGDTANSLGRVAKTLRSVDRKKIYQKVFLVDGNHEHYSNATSERTLEKTLRRLEELSAPYATFLPAWNYVSHGGYYFVGRNGWYSCDYSGDPVVNRAEWPSILNDDHWCGFTAQEAFMPWHLAEQHAGQIESILDEIVAADPAAKIVVVTHTSPCVETLSRWPEHLDTNCYYINCNMTRVLEKHSRNIVVWHHGHTHMRSMPEVSGVPVVCNPRGYPGENTSWKPVVLEI